MALMAALSVSGWFVSPLISKLLDHGIVKWKEKKELEEGLEKEIQGLCDVLPQIKSITEIAEEKQLKDPGVHDWLRKLKDVLYDAEDVLDLYEVDLILKKQRDTELPSKKKVSFSSGLLSGKISKDGAQSSSRISVAKEIKRIRERLDEIRTQGNDFGITGMVRSTPQVDSRLYQKRKTTSYPGDDESAFVGRDDVMEEMIKQLVPAGKQMQVRSHSSNTGGHGGYWLRTYFTRFLHSIYWLPLSLINLFLRGTRKPRDDGRKFLVLPIVGMGGLGKTTLARLVFNDDDVVAFYKSRAWVCIGESPRDLDLSQTTLDIIESVRSFRGKKEAGNFNTLQALQTALVDEIVEPFLLVLDDAWDTYRDTWDQLLAPLKDSKKRCRVIVTTRELKVADAFGDKLHIRRLDFLDDTFMWRIFERSAFGNENSTEVPALKRIGEQIVKRLKGLPLAAKTIGGILHGNKNINIGVEFWKVNIY